jgi:hypothetical protein
MGNDLFGVLGLDPKLREHLAHQSDEPIDVFVAETSLHQRAMRLGQVPRGVHWAAERLGHERDVALDLVFEISASAMTLS